MGCKLTQNIQHSCEYNPGGISAVYLLDINDFERYTFKDDGLYDSCYVENILKKDNVDFLELDVVSKTAFTEQNEGGIYKQELQTFVRSLSGKTTSQLLLTSTQKYLVIYRTYDGKAFSFGLDGGASVSFSQQSGQVGDASGYSLSISKMSNYPQFEIDVSILYDYLLATEDGILMVTEDDQYFIEMEKIVPDSTSRWIEVTKAWDEEDLPDVIVWNEANTGYFQFNYLDNYIPEMQEPFILRRIVFYSARDSGQVRLNLLDYNGNDLAGGSDYDVKNKGLNILDLDLVVNVPIKRFAFGVSQWSALKMADGVIQEKYGPINFNWDRNSEPELKDWSLGIGVYIERI